MEEVIGFLDQGETPEEVEDDFYNEAIRPVIEDETGLEHPEEFDIMEYESGRQIMYNVLASSVEAAESDNIPRFNQSELKWREDPKRKASDKVFEGALWIVRRHLGSYADKLLGGADLDMFNFDPGEVPDMAYSTENIEKFANRQDISYEAAEAYVKLHEGIHLAEFHSHPELQEKRVELLQDENGSFDPSRRNSDKLQILMSTIEGHAEFYTEKAYDRISDEEVDREGGLKKKILKKINPTYRRSSSQYEDGSEFMEALHIQGGNWLTEKALENTPTEEELDDPDEWISRVNPYHGESYDEAWKSHLSAEGLEMH